MSRTTLTAAPTGTVREVRQKFAKSGNRYTCDVCDVDGGGFAAKLTTFNDAASAMGKWSAVCETEREALLAAYKQWATDRNAWIAREDEYKRSGGY